MTRGTISFDTVRKIGLAFPGVEESTARAQVSRETLGMCAC
jgi:hypothetical protein